MYAAVTDDSVEWHQGQVLPAEFSGPASIIQSDFGDGDHKNFEVVVIAGDQLVHWWHDNSDVALPWQRGHVIASGVTGPGCIIQSDFGGGDHKNFEVVVPVGDELRHFWRDNSDERQPWYPGGVVATGVTRPGCIIQSDFGGDHKNFEVVVIAGDQLVHRWRDNSDNSHPWHTGGVVATGVTGPGCIIQSDFGGDHKNFEVVVRVGNELRHFWRDNSDLSRPWQPGQTIGVATTGAASILQSTRGRMFDGQILGHGNFEVLVQELTKSVVHYWHHNVDVTLPWWRSIWALPGFGEDLSPSPDIYRTVKIAQLTGEFDRQFKIPTLSRTESRYGS